LRFLEVNQDQIRVVISAVYVYKPFAQVEQKSSKN